MIPQKEQLEIVVAFLSGSEMFAVLSTRFVKCLCYACLPYVFELLGETEGANCGNCHSVDSYHEGP